MKKPTFVRTVLVALLTGPTSLAGFVPYLAQGNTAGDIAAVLNQFRTDIGGVNNGAAANETVLSGGRREINWDAAALPTELPGDFFNRVSKRGAVFTTPGGGFRVSINTPDAPDSRFGNINVTYPASFTTNSPNRLFTPWTSTQTDTHFFLPGQPQIPATVSAGGVVFTDVELAGESYIEAYDSSGVLLGRVDAPVTGNGGLCFAGIRFTDGERIATLRIVTGNSFIGPSRNDGPGQDVVVMDDVIYSEPQNLGTFTRAAFANPADLKPIVDTFRNSLGGNNGVNTNETVFAGGRREINWDAAALPAAMPADFFNSKSKRGAVFTTGGTGFQVSLNTDQGPDRVFGNVVPDYANQFAVFSANRLFAPVASTDVVVHFFVPGQPTVPATVHAFGAIFTDVELEGSTTLEARGLQGQVLARAIVPPSGNAGGSFVAVHAPAGERIASVHIVSGNLPLGPGNADGTNLDVVAMDDFLYSEPQAAPTLFIGQAGTAAELKPVLDAFRAALGGVNNGVNTNETQFFTGRREINWDAAGLPVVMPADFFNSRSQRGALFQTRGTDFLVSLNIAEGDARRFGNINVTYPNRFSVNSSNRLFAALGSTGVDVTFFVPGFPTLPATVSGFGAVFTDVNLANSTRIEYFDAANEPIGTFVAPAGAVGNLSFVGVTFPPGQRIGRVRITSGNLPLSVDNVDTDTLDVVAMDDFIYGEPQAQPISLNAPIPIADRKLLFTLLGVAGVRFALEETRGFDGWTEVGTAVSPAGVTNAAAEPHGFFRAVIR